MTVKRCEYSLFHVIKNPKDVKLNCKVSGFKSWGLNCLLEVSITYVTDLYLCILALGEVKKQIEGYELA